MSGFAQLKAGRGTLILTGPGTENDKPVETRTTMRRPAHSRGSNRLEGDCGQDWRPMLSPILCEISDARH